MFYALIKKGAELSNNLIKFVALAPCSYAAESTVPTDYKQGLFKMMDNGVYALGGPNWDKD